MSTSQIRCILKNQIHNMCNEFVGHQAEHDNLRDLLTRTILHGESNSVLLIGPPGSGKTTLISNILTDFKESKELSSNATVVKLNGLLHTDDKQAISSITRQLFLENAVGDQVFGSFAENLNFVLQCFKKGADGNTKSLIFILDEFDLFCSHHNQTLLYNLFDIAQSGQAPLCVIGVTCNTSVVELLEKRVRSRFSHRKIWLFPNADHECKRLLTLSKTAPIPAENIELWNNYIEDLLSANNVQTYLEQLYSLNKNHNEINNLLIRFVSKLNENTPWPDANDLIALLNSNYKNSSKVNLLCDLTILEISLIIAMRHHCDIYDEQPFNFKMIYDRYGKFSTSTGIQAESRSVVMKAFQHIAQLEFMVPLSNQMQSEHQMYRLTLMSDDISAAIKLYPDLPTSVAQWSLSSYH